MPGHTQKKAINQLQNLEWVQKGVPAKDETSNTRFYFKHKLKIFFALYLSYYLKDALKKVKHKILKLSLNSNVSSEDHRPSATDLWKRVFTWMVLTKKQLPVKKDPGQA